MKEQAIGKKDKYITFKSGDESFGLKIEYVKEIVRYQEIIAVPESPEYVKGVINLRGQIVSAVDVKVRFKQEPSEYTDRTCIIVMQVDKVLVGLIVEKIEEVVELGEEDITPTPVMHFGGQSESVDNKYVYAMGKIGDKVKLLLDPQRLINEDNVPVIEDVEQFGDEVKEDVPCDTEEKEQGSSDKENYIVI